MLPFLEFILIYFWYFTFEYLQMANKDLMLMMQEKKAANMVSDENCPSNFHSPNIEFNFEV